MEDMSSEAGVRISPPRPEDNGRTTYEVFVKATNEPVMRSTNFSGLRAIVRGKDRRRSPRAVNNDRRVANPGVQIPTIRDIYIGDDK